MNDKKVNLLQKPMSSGEISNKTQWFLNPSFELPNEQWFHNIEGDISDVNVTIDQGEAHIQILGSKGTFSIIENTPNEDLWITMNNPLYPSLPKDYDINSEGWYVSHQWEDNEPQNPSIHWERNVSIPVDISDYIITSAAVEAVVNATVSAYPGFPQWHGDGIEVPGDYIENSDLYDYVRYYILISDLNKSKTPHEIAYYETEYLGHDSAGDEDYLFDTFMIPVSEETLIFYLNQVLGEDHQNFTICLGIRFWCEDNFETYDEDNWKSVMIKNFSLTFTFEKKIDQFTSVSWSQISPRICDLSINDIVVTEAVFNFKYKLNNKWPISSPNSEIRIFINNIKLIETLNLIDYNYIHSFQYAKTGGFDVKSQISNDVNISVSIQLYLADKFELDHEIILSLDEITLEISYIEFIPSTSTSFFILWIVIIILLVITSILSVLSLRSYYFIPHKMKKRKSLLLRTQIFKDADNIQGILLVHTESGLPIFSRNYSAIMKGKKTIFSGFLQAVSLVSDEISNNNGGKFPLKEPDNKINPYKVIELDFKHFFCLILDIEELRTVLILKNKSSKRLKKQMFNFSLDLYFKIKDQLKLWDHSLEQFRDVIPPLLDDYFWLYYKEFFRLAIPKPEIDEIKKKFNITKFQIRVLNELLLIATEKRIFKLMSLLEKFSQKSEDAVIDAVQVLINHDLIIPNL